MSESRVCKRCGEIKPETEFDFKSGKRGALETWCQQCVAEFKETWATSITVIVDAPSKAPTRAIPQSIPESILNNPRRVREVIKAIARKEAMRVRGSAKRYKCARCNASADHWHHLSYAEDYWINVVPVCIAHHKLHHDGKLQPPLSDKDVPHWRQ
jgi:RNase P subunit RPR2